MADHANIAPCGEGNPSPAKTENTARDVRDNRDKRCSALQSFQAMGRDMTLDTTSNRSILDLRMNGTTPFPAHGDGINDRLHRSAWDAAVAAEREARAAMDAFHALHVEPAEAAHDAGTASFEHVSEMEERYGLYTSAHAEAIDAVILTPAPDWAAVAKKLELGLADNAFDASEEADDMLRVVLSDVRRLAGEQA